MKNLTGQNSYPHASNPNSKKRRSSTALLAALVVAGCGPQETPLPDPTSTLASWSVSCESLSASELNGNEYNFEASIRAMGASVTAVELSFGDGGRAVVAPGAGEAPHTLTASAPHPYPQIAHEARYTAQVSSMRVQLPDSRIISVAGNDECQRVIVIPASN